LHQFPVKIALLCVAAVVAAAPAPVSVTETRAVEVVEAGAAGGVYCTPTVQVAPDASVVVAAHGVPVVGAMVTNVPVPETSATVGTAVNDTLPGPVFLTVTTPRRTAVWFEPPAVNNGFGLDTVTVLGA
jgi:hypothetical protein